MRQSDLLKLKPGDIITVKRILRPYQRFGSYVVIPSMLLLKTVTVVGIIGRGEGLGIKVKETDCIFTSGMLRYKQFYFGRS